MTLPRQYTDRRPRSTEEIASEARRFEWGTNRPLKGWIRSAQTLLTQATICEQDGNLQGAYLYLLRHAELVLSKFPKHPEYKDPKLQSDLTKARKAVNESLAALEQWKPKINREHERYLAYDVPSPTLDAYEDRNLAVGLAHQELRRRDVTRQSTRQAGISPGTIASRRRGVVIDTDEANNESGNDVAGVSEAVREAGRYLQDRSRLERNDSKPASRNVASYSYHYPSVPAKEGAIDWKMEPLLPGRRPIVPAPPPVVPSKEPPQGRFDGQDSDAPAIPPKQRDSAASERSKRTSSPPPESRALVSKLTFKASATTESGAPLRPLLLPAELRRSFLNLAHPNTVRNLETCGILCGTLVSNALAITHLVIPDQDGTSDTCDTTEEGDNKLFDYCDSHDLLVCGWIHTHPSQSCFLSSRDLHTSSGYQVMLPEAIAIVCAPRHNPDWGVFRLTEPPGLEHILNCPQRSLFHPHSEPDLYTDAIQPGHVIEGAGLDFKLVDLRQ